MKRTSPRTRAPAVAGGPATQSASDIMTSLIGVMVMVLIGILLTSVLGQTALELADPSAQESAPTPGTALGYAETRAFPHFQSEKQPLYLEVFGDHIRVHPATGIPETIPLLSRTRYEPALDRHLDAVEADADRSYVVLLLRPGSARAGREIREKVRARGLDLGIDLVPSHQSLTLLPPSARQPNSL